MFIDGGGRRRIERFGPRRLAEFATRHPRKVLAGWAVVFLLGFIAAAMLLGKGLSTEQTLTNEPESVQAQALIEDRLGEGEDGEELVVIRSDELTVSDAAFQARVRDFVADVRASGAAESIQSYLDGDAPMLVSTDEHATIIPVTLADEPTETIEPLVVQVEAADGRAGFSVDVAGAHTVGRDFDQVAGEDLKKGELQFGLPAALIVLLLVFGTLVGAVVPLIMATVSIVVALGILSLVGQVWELNLFVQNMVVAMGLALGIDYSLFIVSRLREERSRGVEHRAAILAAASTATRAVVFSGTAFALAMVGMLLMPDTVLRSLAAGAIVVGLVSVTIALTFHPALLMLLGDRIDRLRVPWLGKRVAQSAGREGRFWGSLVRGVMRRPGLSLILSVALLLAAASPLLGLKIGASGAGALPDETVAKQGLLALERDFPRGAIVPIEVVVDGASAPAAQSGLDRLSAELARDPAFAADAAEIRSAEGIAALSVALNATPSSEAATAAVDRLRDEYVPAAFGAAADSVKVGGGPAFERDYFALVERWLPIVMAVVLSLSFVLLTLAFRSLVVPLTAIVVNLLSVGAAYGLLVLTFQEGVGADLFGFGQVERIEAWVPVFLFSVLFGLSMDYQVFLLSRIRERYTATGSTIDGIIHGVGSTARLITGAALIIVVVFIGFATGQLVSFQQMGFGIAVALLIDATLVRSVVIPAAMAVLEDRNWYLPSWLDWLPHVQIESEAPAAAVTAGREPAPRERVGV